MSSDPFEAPAAEAQHDRWGRYILPDPVTGKERAFTRATTIARTLADEFNLTQWKLRMAVKGMAIRPDLIAGAAAADPEADKGTLNDIARQAMDAAEGRAGANYGTAFHQFAQRLDAGEPLEALKAPPPLDTDLAAYSECMQRQQLKVVAMEKIVVLPELGIAGRFDRIVEQPVSKDLGSDKPYSIMDLKSGKTVEFGWLEICIQQALYAHAGWMYDPATKAYERMPDVDKDRALIMHSPIGQAHPRLYAIPILKGWKWVQLAMQVREARSDARRRGFAWLVQPDDKDLLLHRIRKATTQEELTQLHAAYTARGMWDEEVNAEAARAWQALAESIEDQINEATFD